MRILHVVCGIAVLLNALHLTHAIHHFSSAASSQDVQSPFFWAGIATASLVGTLSFIGGILLLKRSRALPASRFSERAPVSK
jgi:predicted small integral membrane protein